MKCSVPFPTRVMFPVRLVVQVNAQVSEVLYHLQLFPQEGNCAQLGASPRSSHHYLRRRGYIFAGVGLSVSKITRKVRHGFGWNFRPTWVLRQRTDDSNLVEFLSCQWHYCLGGSLRSLNAFLVTSAMYQQMQARVGRKMKQITSTDNWKCYLSTWIVTSHLVYKSNKRRRNPYRLTSDGELKKKFPCDWWSSVGSCLSKIAYSSRLSGHFIALSTAHCWSFYDIVMG